LSPEDFTMRIAPEIRIARMEQREDISSMPKPKGRRHSRKLKLDERIISWGIVSVIGLICVYVLGWWVSYEPAASLVEFAPGMDGKPAEGTSIEEEVITIGESFQRFEGVAGDLPGEWARFRGSDADNISKEAVPLADQWGLQGPEILWAVDLGEGHAAPAVLGGRVYILDYDEEKKSDALRCFSLEDGREIWRRSYGVHVKRNHGMSRTIPALTEKYVVTIGPRCQVMCADAVTGALLWGIDLEKEYGTTVPLWYTGQCPLIDDSIAVIAPCSERALMIGVDCETGEVAWDTPGRNGWDMSHSSVIPATLLGKKMYVYCAIGGMVGVSAEEEDRGAVLWETEAWSPAVMVPSPVVLGDGSMGDAGMEAISMDAAGMEAAGIFVTAGYGAGSMMLQVRKENETFIVEPLYEHRPNEGLACEQQTPLLYRGHLFGIMPKDGGELRNEFVCAHPDGRIVWSSGKTNRFGLGPFLVADEKFFILSDDGVLNMTKATPERFIPLGQAKILDGRDSWGPMAVAGGRMLLRDSRKMVCIDVAAH